jgi:hypothetical protein
MQVAKEWSMKGDEGKDSRIPCRKGDEINVY